MNFQQNTVKQKKDALRAQYREKRRSIPCDEKRCRDEAICRAAENLVSFRFAEHILMYAPLTEEVDIMPLLEAAIQRGKNVFFPRCRPGERKMDFHLVTDEGQLICDTWGIREPPHDAGIYSGEAFPGEAVCFVPAVAYDRRGYRLGYGKGYYDRYLSSFRGCRIGVVYSDFIINSVPRGRYDIKVDIMLTERNVRLPLEG